MDTSIKIIKKDRVFTLGANHFGYEDITFHALNVIFDILTHQDISEKEMEFIKNYVYEKQFDDNEDFDYTFDCVHKIFYLGLGFEIMEIDKYQGSLDDARNVYFYDVDLMFADKIKFDQFKKLINFIKANIRFPKVIINDKYIYIHQNKGDKYGISWDKY